MDWVENLVSNLSLPMATERGAGTNYSLGGCCDKIECGKCSGIFREILLVLHSIVMGVNNVMTPISCKNELFV